MISKKKTGSYYTPDYLSKFMLDYVSKHFEGRKSISLLEPSVGDGSFVRAFSELEFPKTIKKFSFTAIDKIKPELDKAYQYALAHRKKNTKYSFTRIDFLKYQKGLRRKFQLIAGNPPYIKQQLLNKTQQVYCRDIHDSASLSSNSVKNIWTAFLVRCCQLLTDDGILAFVLPADLLQVKFSAELRNFLVVTFERVEVFTFDDLLFECKGQDTVILFGFKKHIEQGLYYTHIENADQLRNKDFELLQNNALVTTNTKWSHHALSGDELTFLHNLAGQLNSINHYCDSKPGIVTAANNFFIVNEETEERYNLSRYGRPIIQRGLYVNGSVVFNNRDYQELLAAGIPSKVLVFNNSDVDRLGRRVLEYLERGEAEEIHLRYKCKKRENWFVIPNISDVPQGFFFKRSHNYPKFLKNDADVLVTDSAYKVAIRNGFHINALVYSFYNSLTLAFAELNGRYYGGGVLELTPSEFKSLPVPYLNISERDFELFTTSFENKSSISEILVESDKELLGAGMNLTIHEVKKLQNIYRKLVTKRLRLKEVLPKLES